MSLFPSDQPPASIIDNRSSIIDEPCSSGSLSRFCRNIERRTLNTERSQKGFTSVELIIVMLVLAMLAVSFVIKNPFSIQDYSSIAADQLIADIRYVQMRAMGVGGSPSITLTGNSYNVAGEQKNLPNQITTSGTATFTFDSLGEPTVGGDGVIIVGGNQYIKVFGVTGYVCKCKNSACNASECLN
ncbi:MAG TPA: prepilin-type N-terminal cleavage/methylation domain-containing protein [bacterium]|nr:prepilin-type N-terminal cleavage/methylation domain-containing protein [bacterium]